MNRFRDWVIPTAAALSVALVATITLALVNSARDRGLTALENAKKAEIQSAAEGRDQQVHNFLTSTSALAAQPWQFQAGSPGDRRILDSYSSPSARTGFFLIDTADRVTSGVLLQGNVLGTAYQHPGLTEAKRTPAFLAGRGAILPVGEGITTNLPVWVLLLPVIDRTTGAYRGSFVYEVDVSTESSFNQEISRLARQRTDVILMVDDRKTILASSRADLLNTKLEASFIQLNPGFRRAGNRVIAIAAIPSANWTLVFVQDASEFDSALSEPLQNVGRILVVLLLVVAAGVFLILLRRLRAAREEQDRLQRLNETQEEFISIVSHELRTPVAGILGFLQTGLDHWAQMTDGERQGAVRRAATNARRLQALTRDVLDTESVEAGRLSFNFEPVDLVDEVRSAVDAADSLYEDHLITCRVPLPPVTIDADADRLQQVLSNLLDNAAKNSPTGTPIDVRLDVDHGRAKVTVRDQGPGFDPSLGDRMFEKFVRGRGSTVTGTGLGLYVCKVVVEAHHGNISAGNDPEGGTEVRFEIPLRIDEQPT